MISLKFLRQILSFSLLLLVTVFTVENSAWAKTPEELQQMIFEAIDKKDTKLAVSIIQSLSSPGALTSIKHLAKGNLTSVKSFVLETPRKEDHFTPLTYAAAKARDGQTEILSALVKAGAQISTKGPFGLTAYDISVKTYEVEKLLYLGNADHLIIENRLHKSFETGDLKQAGFLLNLGASPNYRPHTRYAWEHSSSLLELALANKDPDAVKLLFEKGVEIGNRDLLTAIASRNDEILKHFVNRGAKLSTSNQLEWHYHETLYKDLLEGKYPVSTVKLLVTGKVLPQLAPNLVNYFFSHKDYPMVSLLKSQGADMNEEFSAGDAHWKMSLLDQAAKENNLDGARFLIEQEIKPYPREFYEGGQGVHHSNRLFNLLRSTPEREHAYGAFVRGSLPAEIRALGSAAWPDALIYTIEHDNGPIFRLILNRMLENHPDSQRDILQVIENQIKKVQFRNRHNLSHVPDVNIKRFADLTCDVLGFLVPAEPNYWLTPSWGLFPAPPVEVHVGIPPMNLSIFGPSAQVKANACAKQIPQNPLEEALKSIGAAVETACAICLDDHEHDKEIIIPDCHCTISKAYCTECIRSWVAVKSVCPMCSKSIQPSSLEKAIRIPQASDPNGYN